MKLFNDLLLYTLVEQKYSIFDYLNTTEKICSQNFLSLVSFLYVQSSLAIATPNHKQHLEEHLIELKECIVMMETKAGEFDDVEK